MRLLKTGLVAGLMMAGPLSVAADSDTWARPLAKFEQETGDAPVTVYRLDADGTEDAAGAGGLGATTPLRIASVTKTFVAATALRLMEEGKLDLSRSIASYIDPRYSAILKSDGYDPAAITVRHLLSHTSGMADFAQTQAFFDKILADPTHAWTREEDLQGLVDHTDPVGKPGERFFYSDTGYILLGHIIERQSGMALAQAVRHYLRLDALGLHDTYWELMEHNKDAEARRAHQMFEGHDTYGWSATLDLYGGGGLVSSARDMAHFFQALFTGKVFHKAATLKLMLSPEGLPKDSLYRMGVFVKSVGGIPYYEHSGFWGTVVLYVPSTRQTYAGAVLDKLHYHELYATLMAAVEAGKGGGR